LPKSQDSIFTMLNGFAWGVRRCFVAAIVASTFSIALNFLTPQIIRLSVDFVLGTPPAEIPKTAAFLLELAGGRELLRAHFIFCALTIMICALASGVFNYCSRVSIAKCTEGFTKNLRNTLFTHILHLPFQWHTENQTGDIIQRCTSDVETVRNFISTQLIEVIQTAVLVSAALSLMFAMNVTLALISSAFIPLVILYSLFFYKKIAVQFLEADEAEGELMTGIQENLTAVRVVRAFGREKHEKELFTQKLDVFTHKWIDLGYTLGFFWGIGDLATAGQILAVVCSGAYLAAKGQITLGVLLAFISYTYAISWPVRTLGRTLSELSKSGVSITRLREILNSPLETDSQLAKKPDLKGDICFEQVSFQYGDLKVLDSLSFCIPQGSTFGILGATGSGKSTIAYLLNRLYELPQDSGKITIGHKDIREINRFHLRRGIGLILQEPFLFSKTVRENIEIAIENADIQLVYKNAKIAALDENIREFSHGYDTMVGERGMTLSGGQKQRVAIARTLMMDCPILIFDDSMSNLDMETDEKIRLALAEYTAAKTIILISHRISALMQTDQILVLENGRPVQLGTHKELIAEDGLYRRVYKMQSNAMLLKGLEEGGEDLA